MPGQTSTQTTSIASACKLASNLYTCNTASFQQTLGQAKTAAIQTGPVDPAAQNQLKKLIAALGLTAPASGEPADLTFLMVPVDPQGVAYNTGDTQIAALHVFARTTGPGRGDLVWAENFIGRRIFRGPSWSIGWSSNSGRTFISVTLPRRNRKRPPDRNPGAFPV